MKHIYPYFNFKNNCLEAMTFYKDCLGGDLELMTVAGSPMESDFPPEAGNLILHATLRTGDLIIMGSDLAEEEPSENGKVSLMADFESEEKMRDAFSKLSAGGTVIMDIHAPFWGGLFGIFKDRFGLSWMLSYSDSPM